MATSIFPEVTLLITHYNRSASLERLLSAFEKLGFVFGAIIVSDDCSRSEHLQVIKTLQKKFNFRLVSAPVNKGLGANLNKGQDAVRTPYTLYIQEDFVPTINFMPVMQHSLTVLQTDQTVDIMRFYAYYAYPYLQPCGHGFSEMQYKPWYTHTGKIYQYSDHPHLRRSTFFEKFGRYAECITVDKTEYVMCISFIRHKGKALFYNNFNKLFTQENSTSEPSTWQRNNWRQSENILIAAVRNLYRQVKYNYHLHLWPPT